MTTYSCRQVLLLGGRSPALLLLHPHFRKVGGLPGSYSQWTEHFGSPQKQDPVLIIKGDTTPVLRCAQQEPKTRDHDRCSRRLFLVAPAHDEDIALAANCVDPSLLTQEFRNTMIRS